MDFITTSYDPEHPYEYFVIIPHPREARILLLSSPGGWTLPRFAPKEFHFSMVDHINRAVKEQLDLDVTVMRCVSDDFDQRLKCGRRVYAVDNNNSDWAPPPGAVWLDRAALKTIKMALSEQAAVLEEWFHWIDEQSPLCVPWAEQGWFGEATDWIRDTLSKQGFAFDGQIEQLRAWVRSCTLRINTSDGKFYFKAVPQMFSYEPVVTRVLSQRYPDNSPEVLAVDVRRSWMLMRDFGGQHLARINDVKRWEEAVRTYARIQADMTAHTQSLISLGCPDRNLDHLSGQLDHVMADTASMLPGSGIDLTEQEISELRALIPRLKEMSYELLDHEIPLSLEHGDFWSRNVIVSSDNYIYFDWSDSSVSHPFFDMVYFLSGIERQLPNTPHARIRLREAYLDVWTDFKPLDQLLRAFKLAGILSALHRAMVYHRIIMPSIEERAKWEMENMLPHFLRNLLQQVQGK